MTDFEPSVTAARAKEKRNRHPKKGTHMPSSPVTSEVLERLNAIADCLIVDSTPVDAYGRFELTYGDLRALRASRPATPTAMAQSSEGETPEQWSARWRAAKARSSAGIESATARAPQLRQFEDLKLAAESFRRAMIESGAINHVGQDQYFDELRTLEKALNPLNYRGDPAQAAVQPASHAPSCPCRDNAPTGDYCRNPERDCPAYPVSSTEGK